MNLSEAIRKHVAAHPGCSAGEIARHLFGYEAATRGPLVTQVCKRLNNMHGSRRVARKGKRGQYRWWPTAHTLNPAPRRKPTPKQQVQVVSKPAPAPAKAAHAEAETVAQFLARGGRIQRLGRYEASQGLRFDHSQTQVPAKRRCPVQRRGAHAN